MLICCDISPRRHRRYYTAPHQQLIFRHYAVSAAAAKVNKDHLAIRWESSALARMGARRVGGVSSNCCRDRFHLNVKVEVEARSMLIRDCKAELPL